MYKWAFILLGFIFCLPVNGWDDSPDCVKDLEINFFSQNLVFEAMSYRYISQSSWAMINNDLQFRAHTIPQQVKIRREKEESDPFQYPFKGEESWDLVRFVLKANFTEVMNFYSITNQADIDSMFKYIENKQMSKIKSCFKLDEPKKTAK